MEDAVAEGSRLGKMAIQADAAADYKNAYALYQECLKLYVEALKTETQEDRVDWTHEQILIRFERLAELNAWYKRKNMLEPTWLELDDLRDRLETVAPKISTKLRKFSYIPPPQSSATPVQPPDTAPASSVASQAPPPSGYQQSTPVSETTQKPPGPYPNSVTTPTSNASSTTPTGPPYHGQQPVQPQQQQFSPSNNAIPPNPALYNGNAVNEHERKVSITSPGGHQVPQPQGLGYVHPGTTNGASSPQPYSQSVQPPHPSGGYGAAGPNAYGQGAYDGTSSNSPPTYPPNNQGPDQQLARTGTFPVQDSRTYLLTPFLRLTAPVKMYHCYGAAQRYRGGAEGWNIEIKDGSKNPIYYLYGLKQANAPLVEMSLHREDGKKTRCMDIYTPLRDGRQNYNVGDMSYKHYLPTPVDIYSQGETLPNGARRRIFTFSGRRFMWKPDAQGSSTLVNESLYEIDDGPSGFRPTQNGLLGDGKPLEQKLAWYENTMARKKLGRINVVVGLELFIEEIFLGTMLGHLCTAWEQTRKGL
ncbi:hypothetical protein TWF696_000664 [Orbilia brochopaga]|uniref:MIT domain-containing protein n=1 Tax=Orbilia brochopaga TaxID=3140254 RepID=A0AAV9VEK9_9PEZI